MKGPWCCGVSYSTCWQEVTVDRKHIICNCSQESQLQRHLLQLLNCHELAAHLGAFALLHWCRNMSCWKASWIQNNQGQLLYSFKTWWMLDVRYGPEACKICFWNIRNISQPKQLVLLQDWEDKLQILQIQSVQISLFGHFLGRFGRTLGYSPFSSLLVFVAASHPIPGIPHPSHPSRPNLQTQLRARKTEWLKVKPTQCARWRWTCEWIASYLKQKESRVSIPSKIHESTKCKQNRQRSNLDALSCFFIGVEHNRVSPPYRTCWMCDKK